MEKKKILEIEVPEGYEVDKENSTFEKIVFKKKEENPWRKKEFNVSSEKVFGYYINDNSIILSHIDWHNKSNRNLFVTEKQAKSALAMAQISQIMKNDPRFGGVVTDEEWNRDSIEKYVIVRHHESVDFRNEGFSYNFLAFHTAAQLALFFEENEDLVRDYLQIS